MQSHPVAGCGSFCSCEFIALGCETAIVAADGVPDIVVNEQSRVVYVKYANEPYVSVYDLQTGALAKRLNSSLGRMFVSAGFDRALFVETDTLHSIKVHELHQAGSASGGGGGGGSGGGGGGVGGGGGGGGQGGQEESGAALASDLVGELVPVNVIQPAPLEDRLRFRLECLDIGRTLFVAVLSSTDTSFVCIGTHASELLEDEELLCFALFSSLELVGTWSIERLCECTLRRQPADV